MNQIDEKSPIETSNTVNHTAIFESCLKQMTLRLQKHLYLFNITETMQSKQLMNLKIFSLKTISFIDFWSFLLSLLLFFESLLIRVNKMHLSELTNAIIE